ncbi:M10 family metallopeptidase C-terminal domain-containing protein, partial [Reyranella sp.]|uniref:M10 family metallopeptidase C-terminal domain-containing protein n=1 Tax=Reyranella sp. TaxID=1929291 RepID=UPI003F6F2882
MCIFCGDGKGLSHWGWAGFENFAVSDTPPGAASPGGSSITPTSAAVPVSSDFEREVTFITGVNEDGTISNTSYWGVRSDTAHKWGTTTAGTGASITYTFDADSAFSATEMQTFITAMDMWEAVANVTFSLGNDAADVKLVRGAVGSGATAGGPHTQGSGSTLGQNSGQWIVNMETSKNGFDLSGSFTTVNGYGLNTILHEVGHALGLGHGGDYNGAVVPSTQQFSAYDERMWTSMSYIWWSQSTTALHKDDYDYKDTNWVNDSGVQIAAATTWMPLDIIAIQRLYGAAESSPFDGGEVFGFNTNITGSIAKFFDFTINSNPVITIYDEGTGNTLDLSGFVDDADVDLDDGGFSSAGGLTNNIGIAFGTVIETAITGDGDDTLVGNEHDNMFDGGAGADSFDGGAGSDTVTYVRSDAGVDIDLGRQDTHAPSGGHAEGDSFTSIENLIGSNFDDRLVAVSGLGGSRIEGLKGNDTIFGSAENDTIRGGRGNDVIVGNEGNDHLYGADTNLIVNGGFEVALGVNVGTGGYTGYVGDLEGWAVLSGSGRELLTTGAVGVSPFEGKYAIDLDSYGAGSNTSITQVVSGAQDGVMYRLAFDAGKFDAATTARFEVYWGGTKLSWFETHQTYVDPTVAYVTHFIDIMGGAGTGSEKNRLTFAEIGTEDGFGTLLDNARMYRVEVGEPKADDWDPSADGNDTFAAGTGSDVVYGHGSNDRAIFDDLAGNDHFNGGSGVDTLVMDWHAATTAIVYHALGVNNSSEIGMTESYERASAGVGDSVQYLYFKEVERFELTGGTVGDTLRGGEVDDILIGNGGDDILMGGGGIDVLNGGDGFDSATLKLGGGSNTIRLADAMGSGSITLSNGTQLISIEALSLEAGDGDDFLDVRGTVANPPGNPYANRTNTYFSGFAGNDTLAVDLATSYGATFDGGAGSRDTLIMDWSASQRDVYRNVGEDNLYRSFSHSVTVLVGGHYVTTDYYYTTTFTNVERFELTGGTANDTLAGGVLDDVLKTIGGRDTLGAGAGDDLLIVDWSQIERSMGTYDSAGNGGVPLNGSLETGYSGIYFGDDWRYYNRVDFSGIERFDIKSADRDDGIRTGDGDDIVSSAGGNDHLITGKGIDIVDGGSGSDRWEADKSFATASQVIDIDLNRTGVQLTYLGGATVRGIDMLSLRTGAAADTVLTLATVTANTNTHGHDD